MSILVAAVSIQKVCLPECRTGLLDFSFSQEEILVCGFLDWMKQRDLGDQIHFNVVLEASESKTKDA